MENKVTFILGIHNHQPVGNFDHVIEDAYARAYLPFIEVMKDYPDIPFALHNSGILWDWFGEKHPEYLEAVADMVSSGQVELMSAGYYEPILTVIPERDRQGQLLMMKEYLEARFGTEPRGCWLTERIWDPHLPDTLARAKLEYVIVDDSHFKSTGLVSGEMRGSFLTEENGSFIRVFPIDKRLRYLIPFHDPQEAIGYFGEIAASEGESKKVVVLADDGEKFGLWTGTHSLCYKEKWLRRFCDALRRNRDWLEVSTFSNAIDRDPPLGIVYLPTASYSEMMEWALPLRAQETYRQAKDVLSASGQFDEPAEILRGGLWRNFLVKYAESNWMHKRMLFVSDRLNEYERSVGRNEDLEEARAHLYQAQCNCAYWHGLFGGLYLPHLRSAIFTHLVSAERLLTAGTAGDGQPPYYGEMDLDGDGSGEVVVSTGPIQAIMKKLGGRLRELDSFDPPFCLTDTLTRREELYHRDIAGLGSVNTEPGDGAVSIHNLAVAKEEGLEKILHYDRYTRASLTDHFLPTETSLDDLESGRFEELGDFISKEYDLDSVMDGDRRRLKFRCGRKVSQGEGNVYVLVEKEVVFTGGEPSMEVYYTITPGGGDLKARFAVENVFSFQAGNAPDRYFRLEDRNLDEPHLASRGTEQDVGSVSMVDEWLDLYLNIQVSTPGMLWRFPIETVSNSDSGFEKVYQGSALLTLWDLDLKDGEPFEVRITFDIGRFSLKKKELTK